MSDSFEIFMTGKVNDRGELQGVSWAKFKEQLQHFKGKGIELIVRKQKRSRTYLQNRYLWYLNTEIGDSIGMTKDEVHAVLGQKFRMRDVVNEKTGEVDRIPSGTSEMTTIELIEYTAQIRQWAAEFLGLNLPEPQEQLSLI